MDRRYLATLPQRLEDVLTAGELEPATQPPPGSRIQRSLSPSRLRVGTRLVPSTLANAAIVLDAPVQARELCAEWGIERPVAVSPDVHQHTWEVLVAGEELDDPYNTRIAAAPFTAGRWQLVPRLGGRPDGELPGVVCGASPAYDMVERDGLVGSIEVRCRSLVTVTVEPSHRDAQALLAAMEAAQPAWRGAGEGWSVGAAATFVVVYDEGEPAAGAGLTSGGDGIARVSPLCIAGGPHAGAMLLDVLEALAKEAGSTRLRVASSAFLFGDTLPHERYGYTVGPPYDGDADVEVWAEKTL